MIKLGLSRTKELLRLWGNPQNSLKFIHIAGTNGKGSVSSCLSEILQKAGYKTGLYTSPHLEEINECVCINGIAIKNQRLADLLDKAEKESAVMPDKPTEFEVLTALALSYFAEEHCDIVILEVGLGGRLDATNVIDVPEVAVITKIGIDHVRELGGTPERITYEKAGIIKNRGCVVTDGRNKNVLKLISDICTERNCRLSVSEPEQILMNNTTLYSANFDYGEIKDTTLSLSGIYQPGNAATAIEVIKVLQRKGYEISMQNIKDGLSEVHWPGRFEIIQKSPVFILDGSHNQDGIRVTIDSLNYYFPDRSIRFILGFLADKNIPEMLQLIVPLAKDIMVITPPSTRAMDGKNMVAMIQKEWNIPTQYFSEIRGAVNYAKRTSNDDDVICAVGSLYSIKKLRTANESISGEKYDKIQAYQRV